MDTSLVLLFRYKDAQYRVTDETGTKICDYKALITTGIKIKSEHDRVSEDHIAYDSLAFSYTDQEGNVNKIYSDESLQTAIKDIRAAQQSGKKAIEIQIKECFRGSAIAEQFSFQLMNFSYQPISQSRSFSGELSKQAKVQRSEQNQEQKLLQDKSIEEQKINANAIEKDPAGWRIQSSEQYVQQQRHQYIQKRAPGHKSLSQCNLSILGKNDSHTTGGQKQNSLEVKQGEQSEQSNQSSNASKALSFSFGRHSPLKSKNSSQLNSQLSYSLVDMKYPINSEFQKGGKLIQVIVLGNDGDVDWPADTSLFLAKKQRGTTVLDEILVGGLDSHSSIKVLVEIFAFSSCESIEILEFELRHSRGKHKIGLPIKMQFKMINKSQSISNSSQKQSVSDSLRRIRLNSQFPPEEEKEEQVESQAEEWLDDYDQISVREDPGELIKRLSKIQEKEEEDRNANNCSDLLQEKDRIKQMKHLLLLRRNNLMRVSNEIDEGQQELEAMIQSKNMIQRQKNQLRYFIQTQENELQHKIQGLQDQLKSLQAVGEMQLEDKDIQLRVVEKKQHQQRKVVKHQIALHNQCLNTLMGDYREYCEWHKIEEDQTFFESIMSLTPVAVDWTLDQWPGRANMSLSQSDPTTEKVYFDNEGLRNLAQSFDVIQLTQVAKLKIQRKLQCERPFGQSLEKDDLSDSMRSESVHANSIPQRAPNENQIAISQAIPRISPPKEESSVSQVEKHQSHLLGKELSQMRMHFDRLNQESQRDKSLGFNGQNEENVQGKQSQNILRLH